MVGAATAALAFWAELAGCKQLFLRGQHRRKLCQNADEPDNQAEEYDFFQWMSPRSQLDYSRRDTEIPSRVEPVGGGAGARKSRIQDTRDVGNLL